MRFRRRHSVRNHRRSRRSCRHKGSCRRGNRGCTLLRGRASRQGSSRRSAHNSLGLRGDPCTCLRSRRAAPCTLLARLARRSENRRIGSPRRSDGRIRRSALDRCSRRCSFPRIAAPLERIPCSAERAAVLGESSRKPRVPRRKAPEDDLAWFPLPGSAEHLFGRGGYSDIPTSFERRRGPRFRGGA